MPLELARLENIRSANGRTEAACPACRELGQDKAGNHLRVYDDGRFGCVMHPKDAEHRKRIFALAGAPDTFTGKALALCDTPKTKKARTWPDPEAAARSCTPDGFTLAALYRYGTDFATVARYERDGEKTFRQFSKNGKGWKPGGPSGLWPLYGVETLPAAGRVYLVEGEKTHAAGVSIGLACVTSAGGSNAAAKTDWRPLAGRDVAILPDADEPGGEYAADVREILQSLTPPARVRVVELPGLSDMGDGADLADWLDARDATAPEDLRAAIDALSDAAPERRTAVERTPSDDSAALQAALFRVMQKKGLSAAERYKKMAKLVLAALHRRGRFFFHAEHRDFASAMYFDGARKLLLNIQTDLFLSWLSGFMGINRTERTFQFIFAAVQDEALTGRTTGLLPQAYWAARPQALYLSNGDGRLVKIAADGVTEGDNGLDDVLFAAGDTLRPWKLTNAADPFEACALFREVSAVAPHGRALFKLWACALAANQRTKPSVVLSGPIGSGKTRLAAGLAELYGLPPRIAAITKNGEDDFWTQANAGGLVTFDNADTRTDWLADALAAAATDGCREKRMLYTDSTRIVQRARAWIAVTSANPTFAADAGLADRLLVVRLDRRAGETSEAELSDEIGANRDAGLSWIVRTLSRALADTEPVPGGLNKRHPDFATLAVRLGRAMGCEREAIAALRAAEADKGLFNLENDEIGAALLEMLRTRDTFNGTAAELAQELIALDPAFDGRLSAKRLAKRVSKLWPHLENVLSAKRDTGHGGYSILHFQRPHGDIGDFETAFPEKSRGRNCIGTFPKTPIESHQTHQQGALL